MACLFALFAGFAPRLALLFLWLFTPLVTRASSTIIGPLIGLIFLPLTTLMYTLTWRPGFGVTGFAWFWVFMGLLLDVLAYSSSGYANRNRARARE